MRAFPSDQEPQISGVPARLEIPLAASIERRHCHSIRSTVTTALPNEPNHFQTLHLKLLPHLGFSSTPHSWEHKGRNSKNVHLDFAHARMAEFVPPSASRCA